MTELVDAEFHGRNEYMDQIHELKKEISFLNEQIRNSTFDLEIERGDFDNKISEKDATILRLQEEVKSLKEMNPLALAKSKFSLLNCSHFYFYLDISFLLGLNEGLVILQSTLETLTISQVNSEQSRVQLQSESRRTNIVKLHKDYETTINQNELAIAVSYGKSGSKKK